MSEDVSPRTCILSPQGYLERVAGELLREKVKEKLDAGCKNIVISFSAVPLINSLGVSGIIEAFDLIDSGGAEIYFADANREVETILETAGVMNLVSQIITSSEARETLKEA